MINKEREQLQLEALEELRKANFNGAILLPTGTGKSWILIECLKDLKDCESFLYCCDNTKLRDDDFPKELLKWQAEDFLERMDRLCYQSAYKLVDKEYDVLLLDEGDYMLTPEYIKVLKNNKFKHVIFVSATLSDEKRKLLLDYIPIVFEKQMQDIEGTGIVNTADAFFVNTMLSEEENKKYLYFNELFKKELIKDKPNYKSLSFLQLRRRLFLGNLNSSVVAVRGLAQHLYNLHPKNKILIFCNYSVQADKVSKYSYHSKNSDLDFITDFDKGVIRVISVVDKINRGINIKGVTHTIFESPSQSEGKTVQKSGRSRRLGVDEKCHLYFVVPFYRDRSGHIKPTIVQTWVLNGTKSLGLKFKIFNNGK